MKRILVPCDFSDPSLKAFNFAVELAEATGGEVFVLKVIDLPVMYESTFGVQPYFFDKRLLKELEDNSREKYEVIMPTIIDGRKVKSNFSVLYGSITDSIRSFINSNRIDLVIMGTQGASGLQEFLVGSNTEKIVRYSPVPVIALRKAPPLDSIQDIVLPSTLELDQRDFIKKLKEWQQFLKARLHVLVVNTPGRFWKDRELKEEMNTFIRHYKLTNCTLNVRNDPNERDGIISFAEEIKADMVAMSTHGRQGLTHLLAGSITENVVNHVDRPIWTYSLGK